MLIDITLKITSDMVKKIQGHETSVMSGHLGTHFDVMDKEFPLEYSKRDGIVFDVSRVKDREISIEDVDLSEVKEDMFVGFYTGFIENVGYGEKEYSFDHPQLTDELIEKLVDLKISIIGVDFAGIRRGKEHPPKDQYCADRDVFVVENLCNFKSVLKEKSEEVFIAHTYPMSYANMSGLPCRVIAEV